MAEAPEKKNGNGILLPLPWGGSIKATGAAAILAVMIAGLAFWVYDQVKLRNIEIAHIRERIDEVEENGKQRFIALACKVDLAIYMHQFPKGAVDWNNLPSSFYDCLPNFKK